MSFVERPLPVYVYTQRKNKDNNKGFDVFSKMFSKFERQHILFDSTLYSEQERTGSRHVYDTPLANARRAPTATLRSDASRCTFLFRIEHIDKIIGYKFSSG